MHAPTSILTCGEHEINNLGAKFNTIKKLKPKIWLLASSIC